MSKAFTRESDESGDDEIPPTRPSLPPGTTNYITAEGAERLRQRLDNLLEKRRQSSDTPNSDVRRLEATIRTLQQTLSSVVVAQESPKPEKVAFVEEADPENGAISWLSPLARALLSRKVGDKVRFRTPAGLDELTVVGLG